VVWSGLGTASVAETNGARADGLSVGNVVGAGVAPTGEAEGTSVGKMVGQAVVVSADWVGTATSVGSVVGPTVAKTTSEAEGTSVGKMVGPAVVGAGAARTGEAEGSSVCQNVGPAVVVGADSVGPVTSVGNVVGPTVAPTTTGEAEGT
jgi:hypothetical protein